MLEGWEWLVIGVIAIVIILWGPSKIPEFAKALGRAKGEFSKAQKEFTAAATQDPYAPVAQPIAVTATTQPTYVRTNDEVLLDTAKRLGVSTQGKTREQISEEISIKVKLLSAD
jgi:sec-independent protein translocase protein TatA